MTDKVVVECRGYAGVLDTIPDEVEIYEGTNEAVLEAVARFAGRHGSIEVKGITQ